LTPVGNGGSDVFRGRAVRCDITSEADVEELTGVVSALCQSGLELHAVVNNAGVVLGFDVEFTPMSDYQRVMDVNCFGGIRVTKALLPLIVRSHGRVVNVTSVAGFFSGAHTSAYACSKYAFTAFSDALRREMKDFGVHVANVQPGAPMVHAIVLTQ
jgi:NAD(P)-dependent dehydrogenase (short-subunit alcohol dehydrogenase family)